MLKLFLSDFVPWLAVFILSLGYWVQVWKIHIHREVRDLSITSYILLSTGFLIMALKAWEQQSTIFMVKQLATMIPSLIIVSQIMRHKDDRWHDDNDKICNNCESELEPYWTYCADCGTKVPHEDKLG